nr:EpsI family protein [candidate division Zixibacteria bacterium]
MAKKTFTIILIALLLTFAFAFAIKHYRPSSTLIPALETIPLEKNGWIGQTENLDQSIIDILSPDQFFSASYQNSAGARVQLFVNYFASDNRIGGPHSPRNCLPGSGWSIKNIEPRIIATPAGKIKGARFRIDYKQEQEVMDFWYVTNYGETANDYEFKLYLMLSSLSFRPTDRAFIRFISKADSVSLLYLDEFERTFTGDIYKALPIGK